MDYLIPSSFNNEKEVEYFYSKIFTGILKCNFQARFNTDGIYDNGNIKLLAEYKKSGDLKNPLFLSKCICQIIGYIKKIENYGEKLPDIIFIGTENQFSMFEASKLKKYLELDFDWSLKSPSYWFLNPPIKIEEILEKIPLYNINYINNIKEIIKNYKFDEFDTLKINININNIERIFRLFIESDIVVKKNLKDEELIQIFLYTIFGDCQDLLKDKNKVIISVPIENNEGVKDYKEIGLFINRNNYDKFKTMYVPIEDLSLKLTIIKHKDQLIENVKRRFYGEFYTPELQVKQAHDIMEKTFGLNYRNDYIFVDFGCGPGILTMNYNFKELYCLTLFQEDIDLMNQRCYNTGAIKIQYDCLNDDVYPYDQIRINNDKLKEKAPSLIKAFDENKPIIFFMNPPYAQAGGYNNINNLKTKIDEIKESNISINNLYTKFLYRVLYIKRKYKLTNVNIAIFTPTSFYTTYELKNFRKLFFKHFKYETSFTFSAGVFSGTKNSWSISFSIFSCGETENKTQFKTLLYHDDILKDYIIYNCDNGIGLKENILNIEYKKNKPTILIKGPEKIIKEDYIIKNIPNDSIGYISIAYVKSDIQYVYITNTISGISGGFFIYDENFNQLMISFLYQVCNPMKSFYEHCEPYVSIDLNFVSKQVLTDSIIFALFKGYCFSIRDKKANVENEWFWLPNKLMRSLAKIYKFEALEIDSKLFNNERYIYKKLQKVNLSYDAQQVLNKATSLLIKSFSKRKDLHKNISYSKQNFQTWDAGWNQIKFILKEYYPVELQEFDLLFNNFKERMKKEVSNFKFINGFENPNN